MTKDELSERLCDRVLTMLDVETLDAGLTLTEAASVGRDIASALVVRATDMDIEAAQEGSADDATGVY